MSNWLRLSPGMAIARRLMPFGVKRLLYSGRTAKADAAEVNGEFGKKMEGNLRSEWGMIKSRTKSKSDNVIKLSNKNKCRVVSSSPKFDYLFPCFAFYSSSPPPC